MTNTEFDKARREAEVTSAELADYLGASRSYIVQVETGRVPVTSSMVKALEELARRKGA